MASLCLQVLRNVLRIVSYRKEAVIREKGGKKMRNLLLFLLVLLIVGPGYAQDETSTSVTPPPIPSPQTGSIPKSSLVKQPFNIPPLSQGTVVSKEEVDNKTDNVGEKNLINQCPPLKSEKCPFVSSPMLGEGTDVTGVPSSSGVLSSGSFSDNDESKDGEELYLIPFEDELTEGKVVSGVYYLVTPEKTTMVNMSNIDVNRIVCPVNVQDVVYSSEKGVVVKVIGRNVFVKFQVKKIIEDTEEKVVYSTLPVDIHVVCNNKVFSIIAVPKRIPAALVYLKDKESEIKSHLQEVEGSSYEERLALLVKQLFSGQIPLGSDFIEDEKQFNFYKDLIIQKKGFYVIEGEGIQISYFEISYKGDKPFVDLNERMFLKQELTTRPLAVSLDKLKLKKGEKAVLLIIEKRQENVS